MKNIRFIKIIYIIGIVADGFWTVILAFPEIFRIVTNNPDMNINTPIHSVFLIAASLMLGWTILLYLGYRKPVERRFILILTACPVVLGIFITSLISFIAGNTISGIFAGKTLVILILYTVAFFKAKKISKTGQ